ncbi:MAG: T9SS type A sorting domain-containing protein [Candidatus Cloacimonetes bacterium]|nr:T9SS type A sorting domain-containing protein [Candidatus Cloacimonadota bacterium]
MKFQLLLAALLLTSFLVAQNTPAEWQENGIPIRQGENIEWTRAADVLTDGNVVYVWSDTKLGDRDVWAQKLNAQGDKLWGETPILVDNKIDRQEDPVVIATTDGGCIVAWVDFTNEFAGDIYAQKLDSDGNLLWSEGGVPLCTAADVQISLNIVPDLDGGAFIIWIDNRNPGGSDIYGVHVDANGDNLWTDDGIAVAGGNGEQSSHTFWQDGQGGAILAYVNSYLSEIDIYVSRILTDGVIDWTTTLCDADQDQEGVKMCKTGADTFGFSWRDKRDDPDGDIYAQACDIDGNLLWASGVVVYAGPLKQENPRVTSSGDGAMFVAWQDTRSNGEFTDCYVQKLNSAGILQWNAAGVVLCDEPFHQRNQRLVTGDSGDVYVVWDDGRDGDHPLENIYIQHVLSDGNIAWEEDGRELCSADWEQFSVLIKRSGNRLFVSWGDFRTGSIGLYIQVLDLSGNLLLDADGEEFYWGLSGDATDAILLPTGNDAYAVWIDTRFGVNGSRVFAQKILGGSTGSQGEVAFTPNGVPFTDNVNTSQEYPEAALRHQGGVVATWTQIMEGTERVYCQALDADGNALWGNTGMTLSTANLGQQFSTVSEVDGDYYFAWSNMEQDGWDYYFRLYAQKISGGVKQWGETGIVVASEDCDLFMENIVGPYFLYRSSSDVFVTKLDPDGTPAAGFETPLVLCDAALNQLNPQGMLVDDDLFVIWEDRRDEVKAIYGQIVTANGGIEWAENGIAIASYANDQYDPAFCFDGANFYVSWSDFRNGNAEDVAMQKVNASGELLWDANGLFVVQKDSVQFNSSLASVEEQTLVLWSDFLGPASDIYVQQVGSDGNLYGDTAGEPLCDAIMNQYEPHVVAIDDGYALSIWRDARSSGKTEISGMYAQKIRADWYPANDDDAPVPVIRLEQNWPNPFNPETTIAFSIERPGDVRLDIYNIRGQKVKTLVREQLIAGRHAFTWQGRNDNDKPVGSGVYLYRLTSGEQTQTRRMILLK